MMVAGMGAAAVLAWRSRARLLWWWARMRVRAAPAAFRQLERVARAREFGRQTSETVEDYLHRLGAAHAGLGIELRVLRRASMPHATAIAVSRMKNGTPCDRRFTQSPRR